MANNTVEIQIIGKDLASDDILKVSGNLDKLKAKTNEASKTTGVLGKATAGMSGQFKNLATTLAGPLLGMAALSTAVVGVSNFLKSSVNDWVAYNEEIRKLGVATGTSTEDLSRLVQAADDVGVSMDAMKTAMRLAAKNGVQPTIENIAKLSDELLAIKDPTKRAEEASKLFGRGWAEVAGFILQGGDAIRSATGAIEDNLVVTQDSAQAARDYMVAMDNLQDTFQGVKNEVAMGLIPTLVDLMDTINLNIKADKARKEAFDLVNQAFHEGLITSTEYNKAINSFNVLFMNSNDVLANATAAIEKYTPVLDEAHGITKDFKLSQQALKRAYEQSIPQIGYYASATGNASKATIDLKGNVDGVTAAMKDYNTQLLFTIASQDLDAAAALELARQLGLVDERTIAITEALPVATALFDENADGILDAKEAAGGYYSALSSIDRMMTQLDGRKISAEVLINFIQTMQTFTQAGKGAKGGGGGGTGSGSSGGGRKLLSASGSDTVIPPGYPNDSFTIGVTSGERVIVIPKGKEGNGKGSNYNLTIYTNAPVESMVKDFNMMRAWARA